MSTPRVRFHVKHAVLNPAPIPRSKAMRLKICRERPRGVYAPPGRPSARFRRSSGTSRTGGFGR